MSATEKRGRGRPPLVEGESPVRVTVQLPRAVAAQAAKEKGPLSWAEYLRRLVEQAVGGSLRG